MNHAKLDKRWFADSLMVMIGLVLVGCGEHIGEPLPRRGDEIIVAGQLFHTATPVVTWLDGGGYSGYSSHCHFEPEVVMPSNPAAGPDEPRRYNHRDDLPAELAARVAENGWSLEDLQQTVTQFVIHYDACGTSRQCFKILQDVRGLSVHFMLDADGTVYQTLDLKERAWHAGTANSRSIGIEIAQIGAYPDRTTLDEWYDHDAVGWPYLSLPEWMAASGFRKPDFVARPARRELVTGTINGQTLMQYDYTNEQYAALAKLTAALVRVFPRLPLQVPRDSDGQVRSTALSPEALASYQGLLGHQHVIESKIDPGPAFDWDRLMAMTRTELEK